MAKCCAAASTRFAADWRDDDRQRTTCWAAYNKQASATTMHGIKNGVEGGTLRRVCWYTLVAAGMVLAIVTTAGNIQSYTNHAKTSTVSASVQFSIQMPDITICGLDGSERGGFDLPAIEIGLLSTVWALPEGFAHYRNLNHSGVSSEWDSLVNVSWQEYVDPPWNTTAHGLKCWQLRLSQAKHLVWYGSGMASAVSITVDLAVWRHSASYYGGTSTISSTGAAVALTTPSGIPVPLSESEFCDVGHTCKFGISKSETELLGDSSGSSKWGNCQEEAPYSTDDCQRQCYRDNQCFLVANVSRACNEAVHACWDSCYPPCSDASWSTKATSFKFSNYFLSSANKAMQQVLEEYLYAYWQYDYGVPGYPNDQGSQTELWCAGIRNCSFEELKRYAENNLVNILVYPQSMEVLSTRESEAVTFADLTSGIGGNLGLWLGISTMTIMEWLEFLLIGLLAYTCCPRGVSLCHAQKTVPDPAEGTDMTPEEMLVTSSQDWMDFCNRQEWSLQKSKASRNASSPSSPTESSVPGLDWEGSVHGLGPPLPTECRCNSCQANQLCTLGCSDRPCEVTGKVPMGRPHSESWHGPAPGLSADATMPPTTPAEDDEWWNDDEVSCLGNGEYADEYGPQPSFGMLGALSGEEAGAEFLASSPLKASECETKPAPAPNTPMVVV